MPRRRTRYLVTRSPVRKVVRSRTWAGMLCPWMTGRGGEIAIENDPDTPRSATVGAGVGECPWPMAIAVIVLMGAALLAPPRLSVMPGWLLAAVEGILLVALILRGARPIGHPRLWQRE